MANIRLLQTVCAVAMLAAAPAIAQTRTPVAGMTGPNGQPNPVADPAASKSSTAQSGSTTSTAQSGANTSMAPANDGANTTSMAPSNSSGTKASTATASHSTHRSAMARPVGRMRGQTEKSQDAAVNRLNDESYQSAQQGQAFNAGSTSDSGSATPHSSHGSASGSAPGGTSK